MLFQFVLASVFAAVSAWGIDPAAGGVQQINCFPKDPTQSDRIVISFQLPKTSEELPSEGTLFLSSGIGEYGEEETSGVMKLVHVPETDVEASKGLVRYQARNSTSNFYVIVSEEDLGKTLRDFELRLQFERISDRYSVDQDVRCYATVFGE